MAELADGLAYGRRRWRRDQAAGASAGWTRRRATRAWFATLPARRARRGGAGTGARRRARSASRRPRAFVFSGIDLGGVVVAVQPPRGFGENPVAVYHSPDLPPTHHYLAFYRWLDEGFGAHAVVHVGKHGTLEWLPGQGRRACRRRCFPDAALGDLPLVYPFVVNDPGEGTQAKRRTHAVVVDHLVPPLTRADSYDDAGPPRGAARPARAAGRARPVQAARRSAPRCGTLLVEAEIHRDLGLGGTPGDAGLRRPGASTTS